jgi:signal transduction histidine kinase
MRSAAEPNAPPSASADGQDEQKRAFLRVVSHELRTPLNSIIGFSEILASELYGPLGTPEYKQYAEIIHESGAKLLKLVNQVLEISRLESRVIDWELEVEPLGPAIDSMRSAIAAEIAARGARIVVVDADNLPEVTADARGLQTVLCGLVQNAILYAPAGSTVRIAARRAGAVVELSIENPGERHDPAEVAAWLHPFEGGERTLTRHAEGAGLGLSICDLTCRAMGATLELRALPEGGVAAVIALPAAGAPVAEPTPAP